MARERIVGQSPYLGGTAFGDGKLDPTSKVTLPQFGGDVVNRVASSSESSTINTRKGWFTGSCIPGVASRCSSLRPSQK